MIKRSFFLLSTATFFFWGVNGSIASDRFNTHTQHTPIELKPASLDNSYKIASVCFLGVGDCNDIGFNKGDDYGIDSAYQCKNEGYKKTSCALPTYLSGQCPYNSAYYAECIADNPRACSESGYTQSCDTGEVLDVAQPCPYDSSYKKCKCNPCEGYAYSYAQATTQGYVTNGSCQSCAETKYKRKENPCSGYTTCECGGEIGASVCYSGSVQKFNTCKNCDPCPNYYDCGGTWQYCTGTTCYADESRCSVSCKSDYFPYKCDNKSGCQGVYRNGYCSKECCTYQCSLNNCPSGHNCRYETCSNRYCDNGCDTGYVMSNGNCRLICQIGWIYYSDKTCSAELINTKTVLGIVIYTSTDKTEGEIVSPYPLPQKYMWSEYSGKAPTRRQEASALVIGVDYDSCDNTDRLLADSTNTYPAAQAARNYAPTSETKGKWCLPDYQVLSRPSTANSSIWSVNQAYAAVTGKSQGLSQLHPWLSDSWSSTEQNDARAWNGISDAWGKNIEFNVWPVMRYKL